MHSPPRRSSPQRLGRTALSPNARRSPEIGRAPLQRPTGSSSSTTTRSAYQGEELKVTTHAGEEILLRHGKGTYHYRNPYFTYTGRANAGALLPTVFLSQSPAPRASHNERRVESFRDIFTQKGHWKHNVKDGQGRLDMSDGGFYEGEFRSGEITGKGIRRWADGSLYVASFPGALRASRVGRCVP
jgi:hypothetical protein